MEDGRTYLSSAVRFPVVGAYECLDSAISCPVLDSVLGEFVATCLQDKVATPALDKVWLVHSSSGWSFMLGPIMAAARLGGGHCQS